MNEAEKATLRAVIDRAERGEITRVAALRALPEDALKLADFAFDLDPTDGAIARVVPAAPGAGTGELHFSTASGRAAASGGRPVILAVEETFAEDIEAMRAARGVVVMGGGLTGHAAIVSRGLGRPCVCSGSSIRRAGRSSLLVETSGGATTEVHEGQRLWFDGRSGLVALARPKLLVTDELATLARWALEAVGDARALDAAFEDTAPADLFRAARAT